MPTVSVRLSEEEKKELEKNGNLSESVRKAIRLYIESEKSSKLLERLADLQRKNPVRTTPEEIVRMIREDRTR